MKQFFFILIFAFLYSQNNAQQLAFSTAEGAGRFTSGGRGLTSNPTKVFFVTSLADDGSAGTLRWAATQTAVYRTIVFNVSGTIRLTSKLNIRANTTLAGQTAPAGGICIADHNVTISGDNVIVRYVRFRLGDKNQLLTSPANCGVPVAPFVSTCMPLNGSGGDDALSATGKKNIIIDHCTFGWSNDETCSVYAGDSTTMQWCIFSEPLNYSYHFETGDADFEHHGYGGIWGGKNATFHHNLLAHCQGRACRFDGSRNLGNGSTTGLENCEYSNNVIYNWGAYNVNGGEGGNYNIRNNYYKYGPQTSNKKMVINPFATSPLPWGKYFVTGNYVDGNTSTTNNNWLGAVINGGSLADTITIKSTIPFNGLGINLDAAQSAYTKVLLNAGASKPSRDTLDDRIINNVKNRTGKIIDCQGGNAHATPFANTLNAWPTLKTGNIPTDADADGMPNWWEDKNGLNKNLATDRATIASNGYTNLENYLDSIPGWYNHANFESFAGTKLSSTFARFNFSTNWVKDSFTYALFRSSDSLGVYTKVTEVASSMNNISFILNENNLPATTTFYKIGSYRVGFTPDTLYTNIVKFEGIVTPVKLTNFKAKLNSNNSSIITWSTALEVNTKNFLIQRSVNGFEFTTIGNVESKGSNSNYSFIDNNLPNAKTIFYRLEIIDNDGSKNYSSIVEVSNANKNSEIKVYPNPATNLLYIQSKESIKEISLYNYVGQKVYNKVYKSPSFGGVGEALPKGVYTLQIINNKLESFYEKVIIQ